MDQSKMKKYSIPVFIAALVVMIFQLVLLDYNDLAWESNIGAYLVLASMFLVALSAILNRTRIDKEER